MRTIILVLAATALGACGIEPSGPLPSGIDPGPGTSPTQRAGLLAPGSADASAGTATIVGFDGRRPTIAYSGEAGPGISPGGLPVVRGSRTTRNGSVPVIEYVQPR